MLSTVFQAANPDCTCLASVKFITPDCQPFRSYLINLSEHRSCLNSLLIFYLYSYACGDDPLAELLTCYILLEHINKPVHLTMIDLHNNINLLQYFEILNFCKQNGLNSGNFKSMLRGDPKRKNCGGFTGKYL